MAVMKIDRVGVTVADGPMAMGVAVRFRSFPALMSMLMMLVVNVKVLMLEGGVLVFQLGRALRRP
jgi:hypothetical protein